jgi:hypothetical protein
VELTAFSIAMASSFETAAEPVIGRAFARPVGGLLRMRSEAEG